MKFTDEHREEQIKLLEAKLEKLRAEQPNPLWANIALGVFFALMAVFVYYLYVNGLIPPPS